MQIIDCKGYWPEKEFGRKKNLTEKELIERKLIGNIKLFGNKKEK